MKIYYYEPGKNPYPWKEESLRPARPKDFSKEVFDALKNSFSLRSGTTLEDIEGCVTDTDKDGSPEINLDQLAQRQLLRRYITTPDAAGEILENKEITTQYFEDKGKPENANGKEPPVGPTPEEKAFSWGFEEAEEQAPSYMLREKFRENPRIMDTFVFFNEKYSSSLGSFNAWLGAYLNEYFIHIRFTLPAGENKVDVRARVKSNDPVMRYSLWSDPALIGGGKRARIDCDIYAQIGYLIVKSIREGNGKSAFDAKIVVVHFKNMDQLHAFLVYTDKQSKRTFVLDNDRVMEIENGEYAALVAGIFNEQIDHIKEYNSLIKYQLTL